MITVYEFMITVYDYNLWLQFMTTVYEFMITVYD
jgi:hypothetical protein